MIADARRARLDRVVALARRLADGRDPLGREARTDLERCSGLSREGVDLALSEHLETDPSAADLDALLASTGSAPRCHVVLSANVCVGALRAVACAVATAPVVRVRSSRRDPVLGAILARELGRDRAFLAASGAITHVTEIAAAAGDEVHVYGSDEAIAAIAASLDDGVVLRAHGTGLGLAVVGGGVDVAAAADAIARDVVPFDQHGCLSPRAVLVEGGPDRADALAAALDRALSSLGARVPRGPIDAATAAAITRYRGTLEAIGGTFAGRDHLVGVDLDPRALLIPPAARVVHVAALEAAAAPALLAPLVDHLTVVGADDDGDLARAVTLMAPRARRARLGHMQRPPLDGPVDLRRRDVAAPLAAEYRSRGP